MSYDVERALHDALAGVVAGRIHAQNLPDRPVYPALVYWLSGSRPTVSLAGESRLTHWQYHIDVFAMTHAEVVQLAATVRSVMRQFSYPNEPTFEGEGYEPEIDAQRYMLEFEVAAMQGITPARGKEGARRRA